ncbi:hypothetical protein EZS27_015449 [termite gut metagenome]|uniref:H repeat-associated protein N-terminal domain-containing protein n=1 Tax=termite gut metagenome TaxID=433724 RepID=A0A5J4RRM9_9ZZZZ
MTSLHQAFRELQDPRKERKKKHKLLDIIILSVLSVLCGLGTCICKSATGSWRNSSVINGRNRNKPFNCKSSVAGGRLGLLIKYIFIF